VRSDILEVLEPFLKVSDYYPLNDARIGASAVNTKAAMARITIILIIFLLFRINEK
jgi:hypothetical protein